MKKIKRTIAAVLSILMIASSLPAATLPVSAATDPYASKYGVTYNQLFNLYPQYLSPKAERLLTDTLTDNYQRVLDSYSGGDDFIASYMYSLKNGISILGTEFLSGLGLTQSTKTKLISDTSELLMQNICNTDKALSSAVSDISTNFSHMKNIYTAGTLQEQAVLIEDLKGACNNLSDAEVEKLAGELFKSSGTLMKYASTGIEYWQLVVGIIEMQEIEEEMIYRLMRSLPANSSLSDALVILLEDINKDIVAHVFDNYCTKKAIGLISDAVKETINYIAGEAVFPGALATNLGKLVVKVVTDYLYQGAMADDIVQTTYLSTYVTELSMAVSNKKIAFMKSAGSVKTSQISEYEFIYSAYVTTIRTTLESALKMAKSSGEKSLVKQAIAICNTYTYDKYINFCMQELKADIDAGKVKKPSQAASGSAIGVTTEESRISIQEKFRQLQAAYPPNQGVTFTQSYGGAIQCFGFARFAFNKLFDCDMPAWYQNNKRYEYGDTQNVVVLGQLSGSAQMTEANVKELFSNALLGDIIQACGSYSQHTMMVVSADESGVTVYECNHAGECGIYQRKISYAAFAQSYGTPHSVGGCGVTLYRATNYDSLYWDGSAVFYDDSVNFVIDENGVLTKYNGWQRYVVIPEEVTAIGSRAFYNNDKIVRVTMTDNVTSIGSEAFYDCDNLYVCEFSNNIEMIGSSSFYSCDSLSSVSLPDSVIELGSSAFQDCTALYSVKLSNAMTSIERYAFKQCVSLPEIAMPDSVTSIGDSAFRQCSKLKDVTLSKALESLGAETFGLTAIEDITIPKSLDRCSYEDTLYGNGYSYDFNDKNYGIFAGPFYHCENLKTVRFEQGTTQVASALFTGCTGLEEITIPDTVTVIENKAFRDCLRLRTVNIGNSVTSIEAQAFKQCVSLSEIAIPNSVTDIGQYTFSNCSSLSKIKLPDRRVNIPSHMFYKCTSLTTIALPKTVEYIRDSAFSGCTALESFTFPNGSNLKEIESSAFYGCTALKEAVLPETTNRIGQSAFQNCVSLEKVSIPQSTKTIGSYAFQGCELLSDLQIADYSITEIPSQSFKDCPGLAKITLPKGLQTIGGEAFRNDTGLLEVNIPESVKTISSTAFSYPDKTTFFGKAGSYAETFADEKGFLFVSDTIAAEGIALLDGVEYVVMDRGASYRAVFETFPEEATDVITLTASNNAVSIMGHDIYARYTGDTVITATASSGVTFEFTVHIRDASSISIINQPDKVDYIMGEQLDLTGLRVQVNYGDKSVGEITDYTVSGFDSSVEGECQVTVKWIAADGYSYTTKFTVNIIDPRPKLTGILIDTLPDKLEYARKDSLDLTGMIVKATYTDGSSSAITGYTVSGYNALKSGTQTITVTYGEYTTSFTVKVGVEVRRIEIATAPEKTEYFVGEALETEGLTVKVTYTDGSTKIITESYVLEGFDSDTAGTKTVTAQYGGQTATFVVEVKEAEFLYGDANGDQTIDMKDVVLLRKYMAEFDYDLNTSTVAVEAGADVNGDDVFDMKDVVLLRKYMADFDYDTGTSSVVLGPQIGGKS